MAVIVVTGDRKWTSRAVVKVALARLKPDSIIIAGGAKGLDTIAANLARDRGLEVEVIPADWARYGLGAGPKRNAVMLGRMPDEVWAFHDDLRNSKGTKNCVKQAQECNLPVRFFTSQGEV